MLSNATRIAEDVLGNEILCIYCPFKATYPVSFLDITRGDKVLTEAVKLTVEVKEVYII